MGQYGFYFDMNKCSGCKCCMFACVDENDSSVGHQLRKVTAFEGGIFPAVWVASLSMACNHCASPACVENCPTGSLTKDEETGLVLHNDQTCIGCGTCTSSCPYGAPVVDEALGIARKCDGCGDLREIGEMAACVAACSTRCLDFGELDVLREKYSAVQLTSDLSVLPNSSETQPSLLIAPKAELV